MRVFVFELHENDITAINLLLWLRQMQRVYAARFFIFLFMQAFKITVFFIKGYNICIDASYYHGNCKIK